MTILKQLLISHRGNIDGPNPLENRPDYIMSAISIGFDVEIDIWFVDSDLFLGHDEPTYKISYDWIKNNSNKLWIHCKNVDAVSFLKEKSNSDLNYFWHQEDDLTLTSMGFLWTYPGKKLTKYSIAVMPEIKQFDDIEISYGVCSDYIQRYKDL